MRIEDPTFSVPSRDFLAHQCPSSLVFVSHDRKRHKAENINSQGSHSLVTLSEGTYVSFPLSIYVCDYRFWNRVFTTSSHPFRQSKVQFGDFAWILH